MQHINARNGSGGVGFLIRSTLFNQFSITVLDNTVEDMLWIKLVDRHNKSSNYCLCVCYLPPVNSSRSVCADKYFEDLLQRVYLYQNQGEIVICGDLNCRIGDKNDFVVGVDDIPIRNTVDYFENSNGTIFLDFLHRSNMCVLNGRGSTNDFTCVSQRGASVVDYCLVSHGSLGNGWNFNIHRARDIFHISGCMDGTFSENILPDHSLLTWDLTCHFTAQCGNTDPNQWRYEFVKFKLGDIPNDFMCDEVSVRSLQVLINNLESLDVNQEVIDTTYQNFVDLLKQQMFDKLKYRKVIVNPNSNVNNSYKKCKPWWNDNLQTLSTDVRNAERLWLAAKQDRELKEQFLTYRKQFDRAVQAAKRQHWHHQQKELMYNTSAPKHFWKQMKRFGITGEKHNAIPLEVVMEDGSISSDVRSVLDK